MDLIHWRALVLLLTLKGPAKGPQDHPWRKEPYLFGCQTVKLISSLRHALSKATYSKLGYQKQVEVLAPVGLLVGCQG